MPAPILNQPSVSYVPTAQTIRVREVCKTVSKLRRGPPVLVNPTLAVDKLLTARAKLLMLHLTEYKWFLILCESTICYNPRSFAVWLQFAHFNCV